MSAENPISPKAIASTTGAGLGAAIATLITWILGVLVWNESSGASNVSDALAAVPSPVSAVVLLVIPAALAAISGWSVVDPNRVTTTDLQTLEKVKGTVK
jgi:hypothetical protein